MVKLHVYGDERSTCTQRVLILLEELELDYDFDKIDLYDGDQKKEEFLKKNPFGKVPVVKYGDRQLFESRTILKYISKANRDINDFYGDINTDMWLEVEGHNFHPHASKIVYEKVFRKEKAKLLEEEYTEDKEMLEREIVNLEKVLDVYEVELSKRDYISGSEYTIADISHIPYAYHLLKCGYKDVFKKRSNVYNWLKRIMKRDAVKKVIFDFELYKKN